MRPENSSLILKSGIYFSFCDTAPIKAIDFGRRVCHSLSEHKNTFCPVFIDAGRFFFVSLRVIHALSSHRFDAKQSYSRPMPLYCGLILDQIESRDRTSSRLQYLTILRLVVWFSGVRPIAVNPAQERAQSALCGLRESHQRQVGNSL